MLLTEQAQEILAIRSVEFRQAIDSLRHTATALAARSEEAEESSRRDGLTGLDNRRHLDTVLLSEFAAALREAGRSASCSLTSTISSG